MTLVFFNNERLAEGSLIRFESKQPEPVDTHKTHGNTQNVSEITVYLHSKSQRFFVDISLNISKRNYRGMAFGLGAILLFPMQPVVDCLVRLGDFDLSCSLVHIRPM